jgi:hypothetical protein
LVRIECWREHADGDDQPKESYLLGFRLTPKAPKQDPRYFVSDGSHWNFWFDPHLVKKAKPVPESLYLVGMGDDDYLCLAVQCKLRGWHDFAKAIYARAREQSDGVGAERSPITMLRNIAWTRCLIQFFKPGSDRVEILQQLKILASEEESFRTPEVQAMFRLYEKTVAPRKSKPGSIEDMIDDLTDYWTDCLDASNPLNPKGEQPYWKLVEMGFDAVPALIEHINDERLSRASRTGPCFWYDLTVGHLCSRLLYDLSARTIGGGNGEEYMDRLEPEKAREWFIAAKKIREEKWLLDHAIPKEANKPNKPIEAQWAEAEAHIGRVIAAKYPSRLSEIYRATLKGPMPGSLEDHVPSILASKLPREQKTALLVEGASSEDVKHRFFALTGLARLDQPQFRKNLLLTLKQIEKQAKEKKPWIIETHELVPLVERADDRACWHALIEVARQIPVEERMGIVGNVGLVDPPDRDDPARMLRIRFLLQFMDDRSTHIDTDGSRIEVRDYAASRLAGLLRFRVNRLVGLSSVEHDSTLGPQSRLVFRAAVRQAAEKELARLGN